MSLAEFDVAVKGEGERQRWLSTRNLRSFLQVESARQNATFIFGR